MSVGNMPARGQVFSTPPKEGLDAYSSRRTTRGDAAMALHFCHPNTPHRKLRMPEWFVSSLMTVKLQPDVDIDLGQQRNLDSATQAAERECRHGNRSSGCVPTEPRRSSKVTKTSNRPSLPMTPPARSRSFGRVARGASVKRHAGAGQEAGFQEWPLRCGSIGAPGNDLTWR